MPGIRIRLLTVCLVGALAAAPVVVLPRGVLAQAAGESAARAADLTALLKIDDFLAVMRDEGLAYGSELEDELFPGRGGADWTGAVQAIYDPPTMLARFEAAMAAEIGGDADTLAAARAFFGTDRGRRILTLEIEARRALLDEAVEEAARIEVEDMTARGDARLDLLRRFAEANDLIEANVQGALNANLSFYRGMAAAGAMGQGVSEEEMLADVWGQEPEIRAETEAWLFPYLALAYGPVSDADLEGYVAFSMSPQGQKLNHALFAAFDAVFGQVSYDLGRAAALQLMGQDI
ncbi:MAG: DUF2059 domain-containing protein [Paracoccaceae bacterium]|nr:MAG: DUF2059 domain-containing protein [Paracoccaceae bacterium]